LFRAATVGLVNQKERERLIGDAQRMKFGLNSNALICTISIVLSTVAFCALYYSSINILFSIIIACVFGISLAFAYGEYRSRCERCRLSKVLHQRGIRPWICLRCIYDLKGSVAEACPECGEPLAPPVESDQHSNT
jgi:4-hydroxybenzoate polyprenyltransferase